MPIVPRYDEQQVGIASGPTPSLRPAQVENIPAKQMQETGQSVMQASSRLADIQARLLNQMNDDRVKQAQVEASEHRSKLTYGDSDAQGNPTEVGFTKIKGNKANPEIVEKYDTEYRTKLQELESSLGNDAQRAKFKEWASADSAGFADGLRRHVAAETYSAGIDASKSLIQQYANDIAANVGDDAKFLENRENIRKEIDSLALRQGLDKDALFRTAMSDVYQSNIATLVDSGDIEYAKDLLEYAKENGDIDDKAILSASRSLNAGDKIVMAQRYADEFIAKSNGDYSSALKMARTELEGERRDDVERRILNYQALDKQRQRDAYEANADRVIDKILANNGDISAVRSSDWVGVDASDKLRIMSAFERSARTPKSPDHLIYQLNAMMGSDPEMFKEYNLYKLAEHGVTLSDIQKYRALQTAMRKGDPTAKALVTASGLVSKAAAGLKGEAKMQFSLIALQALENERATLKRDLTIQETNKILAELRRTPEGWFKEPNFKSIYNNELGAEK